MSTYIPILEKCDINPMKIQQYTQLSNTESALPYSYSVSCCINKCIHTNYSPTKRKKNLHHPKTEVNPESTNFIRLLNSRVSA
jgi:hypothetical protein